MGPVRARIQYQPHIGPMLGVPTPAPELSWSPTYPSIIPPKRGLTVACIASSTYESGVDVAIFVVTTPDYVPGSYPNYITKVNYKTSNQQFIAYTEALPNYAVSMWPPVYPDSIFRGKYPVADQQSLAQVITADVFRVDDLRWKAVYPDYIWNKPRAPWFQAVFYPEGSLSNFTIPALSWNPIYPDTIFRNKFITADQQFLGLLLLQSFFTVPALAWEPEYPDIVRGKPPLPTADQQFTTWFTIPVAAPDSDMKWAPSYDALVPWRYTMHPKQMPYFFSKPDGTPPAPSAVANAIRLVWAGLPWSRSFLDS